MVIVAVSDSIHSSFPVECFLYILPLKNLQLKTFFLSWRTFLVGKYGIQSTNEMAVKKTLTLRASVRFPAIRFDAPTHARMRTQNALLFILMPLNPGNNFRGLYFSKAPFEGLIFGGAYLRRKICVSKLIGPSLSQDLAFLLCSGTWS